MMLLWQARLLVLLLPVMLAACGGEEAATEPMPPRPVRYATAEPVPQLHHRHYVGVTEATTTANVAFRVQGTIDRLPVKAGDRVEPGQQLGQLDAEDYRIAVQQAQANLAARRSRTANAQDNLRRAQELYAARAVPENQVDDLRAQLEQARAQEQAAREQLQAAQLNLDYTTLQAPGACRVMDRLADRGETVSPGQPVLRLDCGDGYELRVQMPGRDVAAIALGDTSRAQLAALREEINGTISQIVAPGPDEAPVHTVRILLQSTNEALRPGLTGTARFAVERPPASAVQVPAGAIGEDRAGHFTFVLQPEQSAATDAAQAERQATVRRQAVTVGELTPTGVQITDGLRPGDRVVTAGLARLRDGEEVRVLAPAGPLD